MDGGVRVVAACSAQSGARDRRLETDSSKGVTRVTALTVRTRTPARLLGGAVTCGDLSKYIGAPHRSSRALRRPHQLRCGRPNPHRNERLHPAGGTGESTPVRAAGFGAGVRSRDRKAERPELVATGRLEREKGFEPSTSTLARLHSTTELLPQWLGAFLTILAFRVKPRCALRS